MHAAASVLGSTAPQPAQVQAYNGCFAVLRQLHASHSVTMAEVVTAMLTVLASAALTAALLQPAVDCTCAAAQISTCCDDICSNSHSNAAGTDSISVLPASFGSVLLQ
jgi:hypothetical protein